MNPISMNKTAILAVFIGLTVALASFGYGYYSGTQINDGFKISGWVKVEVVRDGKVIYIHEDHNILTNQGKDIIAKEVFGAAGANGTGKHTPNATVYIALSSYAGGVNATQTTLTAEIASGGLSRATATYNHANSTSAIIIVKQFTSSATFTAVQQAGLFNNPTSAGAGLLAANTFSSVNLISGDKITITWSITLS